MGTVICEIKRLNVKVSVKISRIEDYPGYERETALVPHQKPELNVFLQQVKSFEEKIYLMFTGVDWPSSQTMLRLVERALIDHEFLRGYEPLFKEMFGSNGEDGGDACDEDDEEVDPSGMEYSGIPAKTPVSILQEVLSRRGVSPKYELVQIEGAIHEPTFRIRVSVGETEGFGTGKSKKEAKHAAAKNILDRLIGHQLSEEECFVPAQVETSPPSTQQERVSGNPIGTLQEMCISNKWPPPLYEMTCEEGLPHERLFTITCVVYRYREIGRGKSKKLAKRQAAYKMWERLQNAPLEHNCITYNGEDGLNGAYGLERYAELRNCRLPALTAAHSSKVSLFHRNLKESSGEKINMLRTLPLNDNNVNFIEVLQDIATEQNFELTYVDIEEKSYAGQYQCLLQLSTLPVAVCYGTGPTPAEAQASSAHNALEYLKIMIKY